MLEEDAQGVLDLFLKGDDFGRSSITEGCSANWEQLFPDSSSVYLEERKYVR